MTVVNHTQDGPQEASAEAFGRLLESNRVSLRLIAAAEVGVSDAEDVVQDAAIAALERWHEFTPGTNFRAWMAAFVRFRAANHRRGEKRNRNRLLRLSRREPARHELSGSRIPDLDPQLELAMQALTTDQRACLILRIVGSHSYEEIGMILNIEPATARSHVFRSRRYLADRMGEQSEKGEVPHG
ncbi:MAG: RNA polymerase sigma factor [Phycisphaerales bacterium]